MWPWSRKADLGRATEAPSKLASPGLGLRIALSFGWAPRLVPPIRRRERRGLKGSLPQLVAWKGEEGLAVAPWEEVTVASICFCMQPVGLRVKSGRSSSTWIVRQRTGTPSLIWGNGSDFTLPCTVLGSTKIADLTTSSPRSKGPAWAGTTATPLSGAPLEGPARYKAVGRRPGWGTQSGTGP